MHVAVVASWTCQPARSSLRLRVVAATIHRRSLTPWSSLSPSGQHVMPCRSSSLLPATAAEPEASHLSLLALLVGSAAAGHAVGLLPPFLLPVLSLLSLAHCLFFRNSKYVPTMATTSSRTYQDASSLGTDSHSRIWAFPASPTHTSMYTASHSQASFYGARVVHAPSWIQRDCSFSIEFWKRSECEDSFV